MAKKRDDGIYAPEIGQLISFKLAPGDEDIAEWVAAKELKPGTVGQFLRDLIRREIRRESNGIPGDIDNLAAKLAERLQPYMQGVAPLPADAELGKQVKEALDLNEAAVDLLVDMGIPSISDE